MNEDVFFEGQEQAKFHRATFATAALITICTLGAGAIALIPLMIYDYFRWQSTRYKFTSLRLQIESGLVSRKMTGLEIWRIEDVTLTQSLLQRVFGEASLTFVTNEAARPTIEVAGLGLEASRQLFDQVQPAIVRARQMSRVVYGTPILAGSLT